MVLTIVITGIIKTSGIAISAGVDYQVAQRAEIEDKIQLYSDKYGVPYETIYNAIDCETAHTFNPQIQSNVIYNFSSTKRGISKGDRERSYGLVQIHLPDHPKVTMKQATDVDFSIEFMAKNLSKGNEIWSCIK